MVELLLSLAVAMHEHGKVARRERGLRTRDRIERERGLCEQPLTIGPRNLGVLGKPLALQPLTRHPRGGGTDLVLGFEPDALRLKAAVVDARTDIQFGQPRIDVLGPGFTPGCKQLGPIPVAHLGAEPVFADLARRQHDMGVRLGLAVGADIPMQVEIGDHPAIDERALDEVARQPDALGLVQLARNRKLDLARQLGILAQLGCLNRIPQLFPIVPRLRRAIRQHHLGMNDAGLVREVVIAIEPLIV
jgi:hypothetical protein